MKKSRIFIFIAFIGTPFLALGQYGTRDDGFGNRIPLGPPNAQQQRPVVQQYYPRTNVVTSPRPSQTSIAPTQSPATGMVGRKPIIYSSMPGEGGRSCPVCDQMWTEFARNHPGKNPRDYFDIRNDPSRFRPSMEGGPIGYEKGLKDAIAGAVAAGPVRTEPVPHRFQSPSSDGPKIVPDPRDVSPATGGGFYIKPRPVKDPSTMTSDELRAAKAVQDKKNADMKARVDKANKKLDELIRQDSKNP